MKHYFSRVPAAAVHRQFDGHLYANIPHNMPMGGSVIVENFEAPRMLRFAPPSFIKNGEAYVLFAKRGDALPVPGHIPFGVTVVRETS